MKKYKDRILAVAILPVINFGANSGLNSKFQAIIQMLLLLVGVTAVLFIIIGGFQFIFAAGNPESIKKARNTVIYSVVGLVIALLAYTIVTFVIQNLG